MSSARMHKQMKERLVDQLHAEKEFREALDKALDAKIEEDLLAIVREMEAYEGVFTCLRMPDEHQAPPA